MSNDDNDNTNESIDTSHDDAVEETGFDISDAELAFMAYQGFSAGGVLGALDIMMTKESIVGVNSKAMSDAIGLFHCYIDSIIHGYLDARGVDSFKDLSTEWPELHAFITSIQRLHSYIEPVDLLYEPFRNNVKGNSDKLTHAMLVLDDEFQLHTMNEAFFDRKVLEFVGSNKPYTFVDIARSHELDVAQRMDAEHASTEDDD